MPYQIVEPAPTAQPNHYVHCGRGGAGNMYKASSSTKTAPLANSASHISAISRAAGSKSSTGRGGAGNIRPVADLPSYSFDEEMDAQTTREKSHDVFHVGRGGAGNWSRSSEALRRTESSARKYSNESVESNSSSHSGFLSRLSGAFERR